MPDFTTLLVIDYAASIIEHRNASCDVKDAEEGHFKG